MADIHPQAIVSDEAEIGADVRIGPFCVIEAGASIGAGSVLHSHVAVCSGARLGKNNRVFQFAALGGIPQDLKYQGEASILEIGENNTIREGVTVHRGTACDRGVTRVGSHNLIMAYCHIAHDCTLGDHIIMANSSALAGHVRIGDYANLGGSTLVKQRCKIGAHVHTGKGSAIEKDVPAFLLIGKNPPRAAGINRIGLERRNFPAGVIRALREAYKILYLRGYAKERAAEEIRALARERPEVEAEIEVFAQSILESNEMIQGTPRLRLKPPAAD